MMINSNRDYSAEIADICKKHNVKYLGLHGSSNLTQEDGGSENIELNFIVEFFSLEEKQYALNYYKFLKALEGLFGRSIRLLDLNYIKHPDLLRPLTRRKTDIYKAPES